MTNGKKAEEARTMNIVNAIQQALQYSGVDPEEIQSISATRMTPLLSVNEPGWSVAYSTAAMLEIDQASSTSI